MPPARDSMSVRRVRCGLSSSDLRWVAVPNPIPVNSVSALVNPDTSSRSGVGASECGISSAGTFLMRRVGHVPPVHGRMFFSQVRHGLDLRGLRWGAVPSPTLRDHIRALVNQVALPCFPLTKVRLPTSGLGQPRGPSNMGSVGFSGTYGVRVELLLVRVGVRVHVGAITTILKDRKAVGRDAPQFATPIDLQNVLVRPRIKFLGDAAEQLTVAAPEMDSAAEQFSVGP